MHGAGLANTIFMPSGGDVIELISEHGMDIRHLPLVGIFPRLSILAGLNHFSLLLPVTFFSSDNTKESLLNKQILSAQFQIMLLTARNQRGPS